MTFLLNAKAEDAFVALLTPVAHGIDPSSIVVEGTASGERIQSVPYVICDADGEGEEEPRFTGNFWLNVSVRILRSAVQNEDGSNPNAPDPDIASEALTSAIFGALQVDNLAALLSAAVPDFTVLPNGVRFDAPTSGQNEQGWWIDEMKLKLYCCASSIPA